MAELSKLGKYEIRRELGKGAMGVVYEGFDPHIERVVAIKTIRKDLLDKSEVQDVLGRFKREAQAAGRLSHPNIVGIYEYGEDGDTAFIAMEYIQGKELKDYFDNNERFPIEKVVSVMGELLAALDFSHSNGVVHRDIKPANIIVLPSGQIKVADFGIARLESSSMTQAGSVLGTPSYMSPEQFMGQTVDGRSDLFSAGVILYQFLTGEKPFTGQVTTIMHKVLKEEPAAPSELNVQVPKQFDAVVRKAMAKRPEDRFQSGKAFAEALSAAAQAKSVVFDPEATMMNVADADATVLGAAAADPTLTISPAPVPPAPAAPASQSAPAPTPPAAPTPAPAPAPVPPAPAAKKSPLGLVLATVAGLAVLGGGAYYWKTQQQGTDTPAPVTVATTSPTPAASTPVEASPPVVAATAEPGMLRISAVGFADVNDARYKADPGAMRVALREDVRRQLLEKAVALYVQQNSMYDHYDVIRAKLLSRSGDFIQNVVSEELREPGEDGLARVETTATIKIKDVQKNLNQLSKEERISLIRNSGDPKISVGITVRDADRQANTSPERSQVAENLLKEKIQAFGFRIWTDDMVGKPGVTQKTADFHILGEAKFKALSMKLPPSGITITKYVLTSWTVKCIDKTTGEEIYFNNKIPEKVSWNDEDAALRDIGKLIAEEFSKEFFVEHLAQGGRPVKLKFGGLPNKAFGQQLSQELLAMVPVLGISQAEIGSDQAQIALKVSGEGNVTDLVDKQLLAPLNTKLGKTCLLAGGSQGEEVSISFEPSCNQPELVSKLIKLPPAAVLSAPNARKQEVGGSPEMKGKLSI